MIISNDNEVVLSTSNTYKCVSKSEGTVLLKPSQIKKYPGSIIKCKIINIGIIIPANTTLNMFDEEIIDGIEWCIIIYNNKYYYSPKNYIDTKNFIKTDNSISVTKNVQTKNLRSGLNKVSGASDDSVEGTSASKEYVAMEVYSSAPGNVKFLIGVTKSTNGYMYPKGSSDIVKTIPDDTEFVIQSRWLNVSENNIYYGTTTFSDGAIYIRSSDVKSTKKVTTTNPPYFSIITDNKVMCSMHGRDYATLYRGDTTWPVFQDWTNGLHYNTGYNESIENGILNYTYPASSAAPLADSSDMINKDYLGKLKLKNRCAVFNMHRKINATNIIAKPTYLDNISVNAASNNQYVRIIINIGFNNPDKIFDQLKTFVSLNNFTNFGVESAGTEFIVTNYVTIHNKNCYICFKEDHSKNGAISYTIVVDGGNENIEYNKFPPVGIDGSDMIMGEDGEWHESSYESGYISDNSQSDITYYKEDTNTWDPGSEKLANGGVEPEGPWAVNLPIDKSTFNPPGIIKNGPEIPPDYAGWEILSNLEDYNLNSEMPYDTTHLYKINRFHLQNTANGLATKSFIFVTRPDLALYKQDEEYPYNIDQWAMNPDLKRLSTFKYLARLKGTPESPGIGNAIMNSLSYWSIGYIQNGVDTPWLTVMSNQARGYDIQDREIDTVEMGETFHGNKIIYAEPTFKHKIAGTVSIPFQERRDLTLYYTLRMWIEYIQALSLGYCKPYKSHTDLNELDYAVSLFYITTDETMENILYWEKLTGLIPLTVPDSFFEWNEGRSERDMNYSITFAYSFRTIMDEFHLAEINNLYNHWGVSGNPSAMPLVPTDNYNTIKNPKYDKLIGRISTYYGCTEDNEQAFNALMNDPTTLRKFYYGKGTYGDIGDEFHQVSNGSDVANASFLPNYIPRLHMHGVPYVKGPFIEHDPKAQKYILRWV